LLSVVALVFDFLNAISRPASTCSGLHDVANSIATIVSTVSSLRAAVFWAAFFNFIAFLFFGLHVAQTIGTGIIDPTVVPRVIFAALMGAISWNVITWWAGMPSSSSHALIGRPARRRDNQGGQRHHRLEGRSDDAGSHLPFADNRFSSQAGSHSTPVAASNPTRPRARIFRR